MTTRTRKLRGMIEHNAQITKLVDYPPAVWMAMAEDFDAINNEIQVFDESQDEINIFGICWYLKKIYLINHDDRNYLEKSYQLMNQAMNAPFYSNDERILFCLMMYQVTQAN